MSDSDRFDRIEAALLRLTEVTEAGLAGATTMMQTLAEMVRVLDARIGVLDSRMANLEGQMTEVLGRLRIIGEELATHTHPDGT